MSFSSSSSFCPISTKAERMQEKSSEYFFNVKHSVELANVWYRYHCFEDRYANSITYDIKFRNFFRVV